MYVNKYRIATLRGQ